MKPIYAISILLLFGNEVLSWIVLDILAVYALVRLWKVVPHD